MTDPADLPLDDGDQAILDRLAAVHAMLDPPPADLDERVSFAIALDSLDAEVARYREQEIIGSGARASERTHTITFDADSRAVMITIAARPDSLVRIDGWLAPAAALQVELRLPEPATPRVVTADAAGRFAFDVVERVGMNDGTRRPRAPIHAGQRGDDLSWFGGWPAKPAGLRPWRGLDDIVTGNHPGPSDRIFAKFHGLRRTK